MFKQWVTKNNGREMVVENYRKAVHKAQLALRATEDSLASAERTMAPIEPTEAMLELAAAISEAAHKCEKLDQLLAMKRGYKLHKTSLANAVEDALSMGWLRRDAEGHIYHVAEGNDLFLRLVDYYYEQRKGGSK